MANSDATIPCLPVNAPLAPKKQNITPIGSKLADLQNWRSKLDTQVKVYREELSELKVSLNAEVEQLRSEFQELRGTLHHQQEDVTASLRNLGLKDVSAGETENAPLAPTGEEKSEEAHAPNVEETDKKDQN
ncbi:hypothetical protein HS088_TW14G01136 [Tripterygium wilfordii]|uniref:CAP-Gly domain-containing linker protein 1 n=1 Tax=Tripterygium wilfordii TaxID=458696 RepID=A0A7J7CSD9_TRIWF|nr:hypothetical protein HS088_TW14G01136 [Tripterygium wilfordii]